MKHKPWKLLEPVPENWRDIEIIYPYYRKNGRTATVVQYADGTEQYYNCTALRVVEQLADYFYTTVAQSRRTAARWLGSNHTRKCPLVLHKDMVLVRVKVREPVGSASTLGYVVMRQLNRVEEGPARTAELVFHSGNRKLILQQKRSVESQMELAREMLAIYLAESRRRSAQNEVQ